jgi:glutamate/tyrosine decarboxylase-like PLP-dependent enzyme/LmbE family N-acetylglucosaminyl deacetylase
MAVLAHPDDESLGVGGIFAKYASEGVETYLVTATRGEKGRFGDRREKPEIVGRAREDELRSAAKVLGIREVSFLDYMDGELDDSDSEEAVGKIVEHLRRLRPDVVVTFAPDGGYGHPDHIAISQLALAAVVKAADRSYKTEGISLPHRVSKFYYTAWSQSTWDTYQKAFKKLTMTVDGIERQATPWPEWAVTTRVDTTEHWRTVWEAVLCHKTQIAVYGQLAGLSEEEHATLWGSQQFYRVFSLVNGGRRVEMDLFEGLDGTLEGVAHESENSGCVSTARNAPVDMPASEFRQLGHQLVDQIAEFMGSLPERPVTKADSPTAIREIVRSPRSLPERGENAEDPLRSVALELFDHSLHNGHPRFWGYITSSAAPIGMLGDLLAAAVNSNAGAWKLSPMASEIELQTVQWIAELMGYPSDCGGLLVSGGNMANFVCFLAARKAKACWSVREKGLRGEGAANLKVYASRETHTWIQKAADLFGLGTGAVRWIKTDSDHRIQIDELRKKIAEDGEAGDAPFLVVGTAGTVSTGAVDPLDELADLCEEQGLWFHIDGAYGGFAAAVPQQAPRFSGLDRADSIAVDPHKWLYAPLEAGCVLVRNSEVLPDAFSFHPPYYNFEEEVVNFFDQGPQNSRGFRALKVWLALRQAGRQGYVEMISDDIRLAQKLYDSLDEYPTLERFTMGLSICTFRFVPEDLLADSDSEEVEEYLNRLNQEILDLLERSGEAFISNAVVEGRYLLRMCIVNFRTSEADIQALPKIVIRHGTEADRTLRNPTD